MDVNFVLLLCIALIFVVYTNKVDGEGEGILSSITNSNLTDGRFDGSEIVNDSKSIDHPSNTTNDPELKKKGSDLDSSKSEGNIASDESESTKQEAMSNSSRKKEGFHGVGCDPSNMCTDEEDQFVACLRVPGNDGPHLSLLIQNKGMSALQVTITALGFVRLEKKEVHLLKNENTKVKVSIKKGGSNNSAIILSSNKGQCSLELKDLTGLPETENDDTIAVSRPSILALRQRTLILIIMIAILVFALIIIPMIIHIYNKKKSQGNKKYQRVDMELPVSNAAMVSKSNEEMVDNGWDNNWGDDWDDENGDGDEEQPKTPVLPLTPSVSARGLASRRLGKEGWKD